MQRRMGSVFLKRRPPPFGRVLGVFEAGIVRIIYRCSIFQFFPDILPGVEELPVMEQQKQCEKPQEQKRDCQDAQRKGDGSIGCIAQLNPNRFRDFRYGAYGSWDGHLRY